MKELWKDIEGYDGTYEISNLGRVQSFKRITPIIMSPGVNNNGYYQASLRKDKVSKTHRIHRLVAFAFLGQPPSPSYEVNHKDGVKTNNNSSNLEWVLAMDNTEHAMKLGLRKRALGPLNSSLYIPDDMKRLLKSRAALAGITMNGIIIEAIKSYLKIK